MSAASPSKDVSAKDIVSGIISAANRKMLRAAAGPQTPSGGSGSGKTPKKDSVDSAKSGHSGHHDTIHPTAGKVTKPICFSVTPSVHKVYLARTKPSLSLLETKMKPK